MTEEKTDAGLYAKMARVMGRLERIPKNGFNKHFKYYFVTDADVLDAVRKAMAAENICLFTSMESVHQEGKKTVIHSKLTFADGDSGQEKSILWTGEAMDTQDKGIAKASTSALKYCLLKTFLISTGDEPDADQSGDQSGDQDAHWIEDDTTRKAFWVWATNKGLSNADVHAALGVDSVKDFTGTKEAVFAVIKAYIDEKAQPAVVEEAADHDK